MKLYGGFGSPFTRRVGTTLLLYNLKHEHLVLRANVPEELEQLKKFNPLARVPALETDDGMALVDSVTILDYLDRLVGPDGALTPSTGAVRTQMLSLIGIAAGAVEKSVSCYYEEGVNAKRPADKIYRPWVDKMYEQTKDGLEAIESMVKGPWIMGNKITQADVSLVCFLDFIVKHRPETSPQLNCPNLEKISKKANLMVEFSSTIPA
jgi:glutathione S-transferase|tara:strand:+ start:171 stop:794 length:624 start_codon:yes stop_codon:yes gene_type:complete